MTRAKIQKNQRDQNNKFESATALLAPLLILGFSYSGISVSISLLEYSPAFATGQETSKILAKIEKEVQSESISSQSIEQIQELAGQDPQNYHLRILLANCLEASGLPDQALEQYQVAVSLAPQQPVALAELIKALVKNGQSLKAQMLLEEAKKRFPNAPEIQYWVGQELYAKNNLKGAEQLYSEALQSGKQIVGLPSALALIHMQRRQYQRAVRLANEDLAVDPNFKLACQIKGLAYMKMGKYAFAREPLAIAFKDNPTNSELQAAYADCLIWAGDYNHALFPALVQLAEQAAPEVDGTRVQRRVASILANMNKEAIQLALEDVAKRPTFSRRPTFHLALAELLDGRNLHTLAMAQYREGLTLAPQSARGWFRLGLDEEKYARNYEEARACYRRAAQYAPGDSEIANYLLRLEDKMGNRKNDFAWQMKDKLHLNSLYDN